MTAVDRRPLFRMLILPYAHFFNDHLRRQLYRAIASSRRSVAAVLDLLCGTFCREQYPQVKHVLVGFAPLAMSKE